MNKHILVFGTSTTYGAWDSEGGWVQRLRRHIDKEINSDDENFILVYNLGVSGDKSADILKRFRGETEARKGHVEVELIFLFHVGINDSIYNQQLGETEVSLEKFKENLTKLIEMAKKYADKIVVIGSMSVDSRVDPIPWSPGRSYQNEHVEKFNEVMAEVAEKENVGFIEIYKEFIEDNYSKFLADGVHMNNKGHEEFYEIVKDYLVENEII